jgi:hypothetical protein
MQILALVVLAAVTTSSAPAGPYLLTTLYEDTLPRTTGLYSINSAYDPPSLNIGGKAAFRVEFNLPSPGYLMVATSGLYRRAVGPVAGTDTFDFLNPEPVINDSDIVLFSAQIGPAVEDVGVFKGEGDGSNLFTRVVDTKGGFSVPEGTFEYLRAPQDMNNAGTAAFVGILDSGIRGVYASSGGAMTTITDNQGSEITAFSRPSINSAGVVAYQSYFTDASGPIRIHSSAGGGTVIADTDDGYAIIGASTINDAGSVVFSAEYGGFNEMVMGNGGPLTAIVDSNGPLDRFLSTSLNNDGSVAYQAAYDVGGGVAVFSGPDPVQDRVLGVGDPYGGSIVTDIQFGRNGLNDVGQMAMAVRLRNGDEHIVRSSAALPWMIVSRSLRAMLTTATAGDGPPATIQGDRRVPIPPPGSIVDLGFDYRFLVTEPDSVLRVLLDGMDLAQFPGQAGDDLITETISIDIRKFYPNSPPDEVTISFLLEGTDQTVYLDNITLDGNMLVNGDFETGDFAGWEFDPDTGGSAMVIADYVLIPEPASLALLMLALPSLFARSRRRPVFACRLRRDKQTGGRRTG